MAGYLINKSHCDDSVVSIKELDGYTFKPKQGRTNCIKVNEVKIVDKVMIEKILSMKFDRSFKQLVALALRVINDEDADDDTAMLVMDEVELVRQILLERYHKYISKEKEQLFLKKLRIIENEIRVKQIKIKQKAIYLEQQRQEEVKPSATSSSKIPCSISGRRGFLFSAVKLSREMLCSTTWRAAGERKSLPGICRAI